MTIGSVSMALLRVNYRLLRIPLQMAEDVGMAYLDEQAPARLAYQRFLIGCDRAAAHLLNDEFAAVRAAHRRRHTAAVRVRIARQQRADAENAALLDLQRARFEGRQRGGTGRA